VNGRVLINGRRSAQIDVRDRGLQYGDGVFETLAIVDGEPRRLTLHFERLERGCRRLGIECPERELLSEEIHTLAGDETGAVLKIIVTRGIGARGLRIDAEASPTRVVSLFPWPVYPADWASEGVTVRLCTTVLADQPDLAGIKHLNRLEQILARREWSDPAIAEGLMRDRHGAVVCGTITNMFIVREGRLFTPPVDRCGVAGTVRAAILEAARALGIPAVQAIVTREELRNAEEVFLTNALVGVWPVRAIEEQRYVPGPVTRKLQAAVG
jgi:4-amino-4-deoxychorismate lyase